MHTVLDLLHVGSQAIALPPRSGRVPTRQRLGPPTFCTLLLSEEPILHQSILDSEPARGSPATLCTVHDYASKTCVHLVEV